MKIPFDIKFRPQIESGEYEEKQLLLIDLCARLPYGVKAQYNNKKEIFGDVEQIEASGDIDLSYYDEETERWKLCCTSIDNIKPYLRPLSSMTEDERNELSDLINKEINDNDGDFPFSLYDTTGIKCNLGGERFYFDEMIIVYNWLNAHYFDYRGLIEKGLAIEAPKGMYGYD